MGLPNPQVTPLCGNLETQAPEGFLHLMSAVEGETMWGNSWGKFLGTRKWFIKWLPRGAKHAGKCSLAVCPGTKGNGFGDQLTIPTFIFSQGCCVIKWVKVEEREGSVNHKTQ